MTRSIRRRQWHGILVGGLLVLAAPTLAWAQTNTFPSSGNVGIGTTNPKGTLQVGGYTSIFNGVGAYATYGANFYRSGSSWRRINADNGAPLVQFGGNNTVMFYRATDTGNTADSVITYVPTLAINSSGNVGIGTTAPVAKLHVAGDAQVDGNLAAKYQDVAEWVQSATPLPSGIVVVVDPQGRNRVLPASDPYSTRVAGVVSSRPGLLLGEAGDDKVKVAHSGRVRVKVDASYGPVAVGDLLVTSPTTGHAMRSTPVELGGTSIHRPGTLLGKALEPLDTGQGEILVLLTLQ